jgi:hypothetical protein
MNSVSTAGTAGRVRCPFVFLLDSILPFHLIPIDSLRSDFLWKTENGMGNVSANGIHPRIIRHASDPRERLLQSRSFLLFSQSV